jgi:hypothetical protein
LLGNSAFFQFAVGYLADKPDKAAAATAFVADDAVLQTFRTMVVDKKWLTVAEIDAALADPTDRQDIAIALRAEVLNSGVSLTAGYKVFIQGDNQVQAALKAFGEAAKLQARAYPGATPARSAAKSVASTSQ